MGWAMGRWVRVKVSGAVCCCLAALACACLLAAGCTHAPQPATTTAAPRPAAVVRVAGGLVRGFRYGSVSIYRGIPFAAPPVGELRWRPPQPVHPWRGVLDCVRFRPSCPQQRVPGVAQSVRGPQSEDCLYLNVWTPAHAAGERLPVMVWIHGGGFVCGSGSLAGGSGTTLAAAGRVVVVSISYRLGIFGYFALPALSRESPQRVSGNYGLLDQIAALRWVRRNIAAFGGDRRSVTIFGESAGGQSVIALLVSPLSRGLFARAVTESPRYEDRGIGLWATRRLRAQQREGTTIAASLGAPAGPGQLAALRRVTVAGLLGAAAPAPRPVLALFSEPPRPSFQPVIDGYALPDEPWVMLRRGDWARVPVLVGSNDDEANMWFRAESAADRLPAAIDCRRRMRWYLGPRYARFASSVSRTQPGSYTAKTSRMMTVLEFDTPARFAALCAASSGVPSYLYYFTWTPPGDPWGATHGAELPYVFGAPLRTVKSGPTGTAERALAREVMGYWTAFAATGDPNGSGRPRWPRYSAGHGRTLEIGRVTRVVPDPYAAACKVAERIARLH